MFVIHFQPDGHYVEWKAEEVLNLESQSDQDWAVIGAVSYKNEREGDTSECSFVLFWVVVVVSVKKKMFMFIFHFLFVFIFLLIFHCFGFLLSN